MRIGLASLVILLVAAPWAMAQPAPSALPEQAHVTLAEDGLIIHMATAVPFEGITPVVQYSGDVSGSVDMSLVGFVQNSVDRPLVGTYVYAATIALEPGQTITYQAGHDARSWTTAYSVSMPPSDAIRFIATGDIGVDNIGPDGGPAATASETPFSIQVRDLAIAQDADLFIVPGDLAYDNSHPGWDKYMRMQEPLQGTVATMPSIGNHEFHDDDPVWGYSRFLEHYVLPGNEQDFLFRAGPVTFIAMNSDAICAGDHYRTSYGHEAEPCPYGEPDEARMAALDAMLTEADQDDNPWTVLYWHHPTYSWGRHGNDHGQQILWGPIIDAHDVDLVVTSHDHLYSRSHQIAAGEVSIAPYHKGDGPIYVVLGGGGRSLYTPPGDEEPKPDWFASGGKFHHVGVFEADAKTLSFEVVALNGSVMDTFSIVPAQAPPEPDPESPAGSGALMVVVLGLAATWMRRRPGTR